MTVRYYVMKTEAQKEHVVAIQATHELGFPTLIPMYTVYKTELGKRVPVANKVLFPRYIFVQFDVEADRAKYPGLNRLRGAAAVKPGSKMSLLCGVGNTPHAIPDAAMQIILNREVARLEDQTPKTVVSPFKIGDRVTVTDGPFANFEAMISADCPRGRVKALLEIFGQQVPTEFNIGDLRAAV